MKKLDELRFLLVSILAITLACLGKTKEQIMPEVQTLLGYTQFKKYLEEYKQ